MFKKIFLTTITALLILLFLYIAVTKMLNYNMFRHILSVSPLIGSGSTVVALSLLIIMIWISILLLMPATRLWGMYGAATVMLVITLYLGYVIYFTVRENYPFSGVIRPRMGIFGLTWKQFFAFDIFFLLLSLLGILLQIRWTVKEKERELPPIIFT